MERNSMSDNEAVRILKLGSSFTGEEELSAYRTLAKKYHPDYYEDATDEEKKYAHEKMANINAAHDYLKAKYFSNSSDMKKRVNIRSTSSYSSTYNNSSSGFNTSNKNYYNKESSDLFLYKKKKIKEILQYTVRLSDYSFPDYISKIMVEIITTSNKYILIINEDATKESVDSDFSIFKMKLATYYYQILDAYIKHNNINLKYFENNLDFDCSAVEFYEQLEMLKRKYESQKRKDELQKLNQLLDRLNKEIEKYKNYIGYEDLKTFILAAPQKVASAIGDDINKNYVVNNAINNMHKIITDKFEDYFKDLLFKDANKYKDYAGYNEFIKMRIPGKIDTHTFYVRNNNFDINMKQEFISTFNDEIENLFARSFAIIEKLNTLKTIFKNNPKYLEDDKLNEIYEKLNNYENDFNSGADISILLNNLEEELEKQFLYRENSELIKKVYEKLLTNYHNKLAILKLPTDYKKAIELSKIFNTAMNVFEKVESGEIELNKALEILSKIKFDSYNEDMDLFDDANVINIKSGIYIKNPDYMNDTYYDESLFYLKEENGDYFIYSTGGSSTGKEKISFDKIKTEFMSLEEFLQKSEYIGMEYEYGITNYSLLLYRIGQVCLVNNGIGFRIEQNLTVIPAKMKKPSDYSKYGGDYKDINELIVAIKKQVEKNVISYEKRSNANYKIH